jgi:ABC-type phosphate transport system substrate-binding protein
MRGARGLIGALALLLVVALTVAGCGVSYGSSTTKTAASKAHRQGGGSHASDKTDAKPNAKSDPDTAIKHVKLPTRPPGQLILDGFSPGSLAQQAYTEYQRQGGSESLTIESDSAASSFQRLCDGQADLVDSSSQLTANEETRCQENGITPVQIQVASDAIVFATENETDVGADCLTVPQVRATLRAGSPVSNWSQLGFDRMGFSVAGPEPDNSQFQFFGPSLTGATGMALNDLRDDYKVESSEDGIRRFVTGTDKTGELAGSGLSEALAEIQTAQNWIRGFKATERGASTWIKSSEKFHKTEQVAEATDKFNRAVDGVNAWTPTLVHWQAVAAADRRIQKRARAVLGRVGIFEYGYYTLYEQQLRPLEISAKATPEDCSFPSAQTITTGDYPLSRRMLITFSLQSLRRNPGERQFLLSYLKNVNSLATSEQLVPLPSDVLTAEENWLEGHKATRGTSSTPQPAPKAGEATSMSGAATGSGDDASGGSDSAASFGGTTTTGKSSGSSGSAGGGSDLVPAGDH